MLERKPFTHPDAPGVEFRWNGGRTINMFADGQCVGAFTCGMGDGPATRAEVVACINRNITAAQLEAARR